MNIFVVNLDKATDRWENYKNDKLNEICEITNEEQSKISHNLKILTRCNVLDCKIDGKKRIYSINNDTIVPLMELVEKHVEKNCSKCWIKEKNEEEEK